MKTRTEPCGCLVERYRERIVKMCPACEAAWSEIHERAAADHRAQQHYQDAITGANPKLTAQLIRGLKESQ